MIANGRRSEKMFARTHRLFLRPIWPEDTEQLFNAIADEQILRNIAFAPWHSQNQDAVRFEFAAHNINQPNFLLWRRTEGEPELLGSCGIGLHEGVPELVFWISRKFWGLGYATEAAHVVIHLARSLGHNRLSAYHFFDNPAAGRVLRKLGFRHNRQMVKRMCEARGEAVQSLVYEISLNASVTSENAIVVPPTLALPTVMQENLVRIAA
jgi:RimJ/RimL family protein N-acetyltransferase